MFFLKRLLQRLGDFPSNKKNPALRAAKKGRKNSVELEATSNDLREKELETVIPRELNSEVIVLSGEHRGEVGKMLSRDKKKDEVIV